MDNLILDEKEITEEALLQCMNEARKNKQKIVEISKGVYKTLFLLQE